MNINLNKTPKLLSSSQVVITNIHGITSIILDKNGDNVEIPLKGKYRHVLDEPIYGKSIGNSTVNVRPIDSEIHKVVIVNPKGIV